jgi:hypothetical protein
MGVEKAILKPGNGIDIPKKHDEVSMEYTGSTTVHVPRQHVLHNWQDGSIPKMRPKTRANSESLSYTKMCNGTLKDLTTMTKVRFFNWSRRHHHSHWRWTRHPRSVVNSCFRPGDFPQHTCLARFFDGTRRRLMLLHRLGRGHIGVQVELAHDSRRESHSYYLGVRKSNARCSQTSLIRFSL